MQPPKARPAPKFCQPARSAPQTQKQGYKLHVILIIVLCAALSRVKDWVRMADSAEEKEA
jgi:hypothetical protein